MTSFDSTSAFRQAFKDDKDNYHTVDRTYTAIRVPQVDGYPRLKAQILAGQIDQDSAIDRERACLRAMQEYDTGDKTPPRLLTRCSATTRYSAFDDYADAYRKVLDDAPWRDCPCKICAKVGNQRDTIPGIGTQQAARIPQSLRVQAAP